MADSLTEKLKAMGVRFGTQNLPKPQPKQGYGIHQVVPGEVRTTAFGDTFLVEKRYPVEYQHGVVPLRISHPLERLFEWGNTSTALCDDPRRFIYLDTETTGLSGGTGTYAFLVGIGRYVDDGFQVIQCFMRNPTEEAALLAAVEQAIDPCQVLVTFNGKSFDAPLLNTRYTLNGMATPLKGLPHLDLLPLARRLWRDRLPSRALGYLEVSILGAYRTQEEVPGWMIPQLYFDYLRSGDARPLQGVFYHNAMDILALAALLNHTAGMLSAPLGDGIEEGLDRIALARLSEDQGHADEAVQIYRMGLEQGLAEPAFWEALERLSMLYRRMGLWPEAMELWRKAAEHGQVYACIELAKYEEHTHRDIFEAVGWTRKAIEIISNPRYPFALRRQMAPELSHRLERLMRKRGDEEEELDAD